MNGDSTRSEMSVEEYERRFGSIRHAPYAPLPLVWCEECGKTIVANLPTRSLAGKPLHLDCEQGVRLKVAQRLRVTAFRRAMLPVAFSVAMFGIENLPTLWLSPAYLVSGAVLWWLLERSIRGWRRACAAASYVTEPWAKAELRGRKP